MKRTIWLTENRIGSRFVQRNQDFKITKLKNSTEFKVGEYLSEEEVNSLIRRRWDIIIREK